VVEDIRTSHESQLSTAVRESHRHGNGFHKNGDSGDAARLIKDPVLSRGDLAPSPFTGAHVHSPSPTARPLTHSRAVLRRLSPREIDVWRLIAEGHSTKEIAYHLRVSFKTAVSHRTHLLKKLGIHETATLVRLAVRVGLVGV